MSDSFPAPPGLPDWLRVDLPASGKSTQPDARAYKEVQLLVGRCECLRCGNVWYTKQNKRPVSCSKCHSAYWDRPPKWKQRTREQREAEKLAKKAEKIRKQQEVNQQLHEALEKVLTDAGIDGPEADRVSRKSIKNLFETFRNPEKHSTEDSEHDSASVEILDSPSGNVSAQSPYFGAGRGSAELPAEAQGGTRASVSHWDAVFQDQGVQAGQSDDDGPSEGIDDPEGQF